MSPNVGEIWQREARRKYRLVEVVGITEKHVWIYDGIRHTRVLKRDFCSNRYRRQITK